MSKGESYKIEFQPTGRRVTVPAGINLLRGAHDCGIELAAACGGRGDCGQCKVVILEGKVSEITSDEKFLLSEQQLADGLRLACCVLPLSNLKVEIPKGSLITSPHLQTASDLPDIKVDRELDANIFQGKPLGFAVDLGTTTIVACLVDLVTGKTLATAGATNPQIGYGEDVISRLNFAMQNPDGGKILAEKVRQELDKLLGEVLKQTNLPRSHVADACIVGNTAMSHLLLELPTEQLCLAPYKPAVSEAMNIPVAETGLDMANGANVYLPAVIGGFIGADHLAMLLATGIEKIDKTTLAIDIGTNSEIALYIPEKSELSSASCASGPAFEGAHITCGMRAAAGAIERIKIDGTKVTFKTVADAKPVGICGSGIIDAIAELRKNGLINEKGRFQKSHPLVQQIKDDCRCVLATSADSGTGDEIIITQSDVNQIQLAKGAINAGINILLESVGVTLADVEEVVIAGAFGTYIDLENAISMGLFPFMPNAQYHQVGNAAFTGAKWMLVSDSARRDAERIAVTIRYLELAANPQFDQYFVQGMLFSTI